MNGELDKSQIVKQWGPWTLTKDGNLHNSDVSKKCGFNWYVSLNDIKTEIDFSDKMCLFYRKLLGISDQRPAYSILWHIIWEIFPEPDVDGTIDYVKPWDGKNSSFYVNKYIQKNHGIKRANLKPSLRFKILHRDQYRCQTCGASAAGGADLHIDHILPVSKGGTNDESNLRALCSECNIGRGNRYDT